MSGPNIFIPKAKILITGGTGYIGNYIAKILAATKPDVLVLSMSRKGVGQDS